MDILDDEACKAYEYASGLVNKAYDDIVGYALVKGASQKSWLHVRVDKHAPESGMRLSFETAETRDDVWNNPNMILFNEYVLYGGNCIPTIIEFEDESEYAAYILFKPKPQSTKDVHLDFETGILRPAVAGV